MGLLPPGSNSSTTQDFGELMKQAKDLIERKDTVEKELRDMEDRLLEAGIGMTEPLVDSAGFPRSEVDVHTVRTNRNLIIRLRNDHKEIMADIEKVLHKVHEAKREGQVPEAAPAVPAEEEDTMMVDEVPVAFAIVNAVAPDSPAYSAGLRRNDRILKFGHLDHSNHQRLQALNALIGQSENRELSVSFLRDGEAMDSTVTPRSGWGGRGTLGCHLLPL
ncbi:hypothetical protein EDC94DRAFT_616418 [Helicostylum pulchrum]|uniref:PDZ domain-containing protein n=1 Tax=Helicostylum pulchrum TaxID=562976 RepID=A0ABP9Y1L8_9FUNG|nr:hypothetical protein EDC94DRAFT_616418 [Helicostylum pulchrum]